MKINPISVHKLFTGFNFKRDDEYIDIPLIWDDETLDSFEYSDSSANTNSAANRPAASNNQTSPFTKLNKYKSAATKIGGTLLVAPTAAASVADTVETSLAKTAESLKNSSQSIKEIKEEAQNILGIHRKNDEHSSDNTGNTDTLHNNTVVHHSPDDAHFHHDTLTDDDLAQNPEHHDYDHSHNNDDNTDTDLNYEQEDMTDLF